MVRVEPENAVTVAPGAEHSMGLRCGWKKFNDEDAGPHSFTSLASIGDPLAQSEQRSGSLRHSVFCTVHR
jgi:hypothetical protein